MASEEASEVGYGVDVPASLAEDPHSNQPDSSLDKRALVALSAGDLLGGRFEIVGELGVGGMGAVYKAQDLHREHQIVALKHFPRQTLTAESESLIRSEFLHSANLRHPNLLTVHDFGEDPQSRDLYFTQEFFAGVPLTRELGKPLLESRGLDRFLVIIAEVLRALEFIHCNGLVHGDVKPDHVLCTATGDAETIAVGTVKLIDLGLMRPERQSLPGRLWGTPAYVAPETVQGRAIDRRADLYAMGVILYAAVTARLPFEGSHLDILKGHVDRVPMAPRHWTPKLAPALEGVILRLLQKNPEDRYATASCVLEELAQLTTVALPLETPESERSYVEIGRAQARRAQHELLQQHLRQPLGWIESASQSAVMPGEPRVGSHRLVILEGERGSGRSQLLGQLERGVQACGGQVCHLRCRESEDWELLALLLQQLRGLCEWVGAESSEPALARLDRTLRGVHSSQVETPDGDSVDPGDSLDRGDSESALLNDRQLWTDAALAVAELSQRVPLLLAVSDLERGGRWVSRFVRGLAMVVADGGDPAMRLAVVVTTLQGDRGRFAGALEFLHSDAIRQHAMFLGLDPLDEAATDLLLRRALGEQDYPAPFVEDLSEHSDGNLNATCTLLQKLIQQRLVRKSAAGWIVTESSIPQWHRGPVRTDIRVRIAKLSDEETRVAVAHAILGEQAQPHRIEHLARLPQGALPQIEKALVAQHVLRELTELDGTHRMGLRNRKTLSTLRGLIPSTLRRQLHALAGELLESELDESATETAQVLAPHFLQGGDADRGCRYGLLAARELEGSSSRAHARSTLAAVLRVVEEPSTRHYIRLEMARLSCASGDFQGALRECQEALHGCDRLPLSIALIMARCHAELGEFPRAEKLLIESLASVAECTLEEQLDFYYVSALVAQLRDDFVTSVRCGLEAERIATKGDLEDDDSAALHTLAKCRWLLTQNYVTLASEEDAKKYCRAAMRSLAQSTRIDSGALLARIRSQYHELQHRPDLARVQLHAALRGSEASGDKTELADCLLQLGRLELAASRVESAHSYLSRARQLFQQTMSRPRLLETEICFGVAERYQGRVAEVESRLGEVVRRSEQLGKSWTHGRSLLALSETLLWQGKLAAAGKPLGLLEQLCLSVGAELVALTPCGSRVRSEIAEAEGNLELALEHMERSLADSHEIEHVTATARALRGRTRLLLAIGRVGEARRSLSALTGVAQRGQLTHEQAWCRALDALVLEAENKQGSAGRAYSHAHRWLLQLGGPRDIAEVYLERGRYLLTEQRLEEAYLDLQEGQALAQMLQIPHLQARFLLAQARLEGALAKDAAGNAPGAALPGGCSDVAAEDVAATNRNVGSCDVTTSVGGGATADAKSLLAQARELARTGPYPRILQEISATEDELAALKAPARSFSVG